MHIENTWENDWERVVDLGRQMSRLSSNGHKQLTFDRRRLILERGSSNAVRRTCSSIKPSKKSIIKLFYPKKNSENIATTKVSQNVIKKVTKFGEWLDPQLRRRRGREFRMELLSPAVSPLRGSLGSYCGRFPAKTKISAINVKQDWSVHGSMWKHCSISVISWLFKVVSGCDKICWKNSIGAFNQTSKTRLAKKSRRIEPTSYTKHNITPTNITIFTRSDEH